MTPPAPGALGVRPERLLVLEDLDSDFRLLQRHLARAGLAEGCRRVDGAAGLEQALADGPWDLVLADHRLPGLSFEPLLRQLQAALPGVPVILVSGAIGEEAAADLLRLGIADFVLKDRLARLVPAIDRCLDDVRRRREAERAEQALRESELFAGTVIRSLSDGLFIAQDGAFAFCNPALPRMLGYTPEQFAGCPFAQVVDAEWLPLWTERFQQRLDPSLPLPESRYDVVFRHREGHRLWAELHAERFTYHERPAVLGLVRDVTEPRRLQAELEAHRHRLEQLVEERTARAEAANRSKTAFLATMSHEIRTPLNAITGKVYLLRERAADPQLRDELEVVDQAAQHLLQIVDGVLDLSKIEAGRLVLEQIDFAFDDLLARCCGLVAGRARDKGLRFEVHNAAAGRWLRGDPTRLSQLLINLLANAVKFTEHGEVRLDCRAEPLDGQRLRLELRVQDSGIGIAPDRLARLFTPFEQAEASTTRRFGGSGLGLSIARSLAGLMNGDIAVRSTPGVGSTFSAHVELEAAPAAQRASTTVAGDASRLLRQRHGGRRVLLADDNEINQIVGQELLAAVGLHVDTAADGEQALRLAADQAYAAVLMDVQMPVMDGLAAASAIRRLPGRERLPIVAMTANAFIDEREACLAAGMDAHLPKPVQAEALYATLLHWLDASAAAAG